MALELVYTSAARGLRAGTSGFCTVAMTRGLAPALVPRLEALGGYRPGPSGFSPRAHCFWRVETAGAVSNVLALVGPAPPDHTQRTNKIASYLVLGPDELPAAGPAWLLSRPGLVREGWSGAPAWIERPVTVPDSGPRPSARCEAWKSAAGDAGWAGVIASSFLRDQSRPIHVVWSQGMDPLALVGEVLSLMPEWARWRATFSTYFLQTVAGTPCILRFCLAGTPTAESARQSKGLVVDLTRPLGEAPDGRFARVARLGVDREAVSRPGGGGSAALGLDGEIELEPVEDEPEPRSRATPRAAVPTMSPAPSVATAEEPDHRLPVRIAMWVAGLLLALIALGGLLYLVSLPSAPPPSPPAAAPLAEPPLPEELPAPPAPDRLVWLDRAQVDEHAPEPALAPAANEPPLHVAPEPATAPPAVEDPLPVTAPHDASPEVPVVVDPPYVGECLRMNRQARSDALGIARWTAKVGGSPAVARVAFLVPEPLRAVGVRSTETDLSVEGSRFAASVALEKGQVSVDLRDCGGLPEAVASAVGAGSDAAPCERLMGAITIDLLDATGASVGRAHCRPSRGTGEIRVGATEAAVLDDLPVLPLVVRLVRPGAAPGSDAAGYEVVEPGGSLEIQASALVRVRVDRGIEPGRIRASAIQRDHRELAIEVGRCTGELDAVRSLMEAIVPLGRPIAGPVPDGAQVVALDAGWRALTPRERMSIDPDMPDSPPRTPEAMLGIHALLQPRLRARRDELQHRLGELRVKPQEFPKFVLRLSTFDGAVVAERGVTMGGVSR